MTYKDFESLILSKRKSGRPLCIAHRGFSGVALENTVASVKKGLEAPFVDGIEFDLQGTSDGHIVLRHNRSLKTKNGYKWISEITFSELREYLSPDVCPEFVSVLEAWQGYKKIMDIEIKTPKIVSKVISLCKEYNLYENVIFSSLYFEMHEEIMSLDQDVARMMGYPRDRGKDIAQRKWAYYFVQLIVDFMKYLVFFKYDNMLKSANTKFISLYHKIISKKLTELIHAKHAYLIGVAINLNGDTKEDVAKREIDKLLAADVDVIKTDFPQIVGNY